MVFYMILFEKFFGSFLQKGTKTRFLFTKRNKNSVPFYKRNKNTSIPLARAHAWINKSIVLPPAKVDLLRLFYHKSAEKATPGKENTNERGNFQDLTLFSECFT